MTQLGALGNDGLTTGEWTCPKCGAVNKGNDFVRDEGDTLDTLLSSAGTIITDVTNASGDARTKNGMYNSTTEGVNPSSNAFLSDADVDDDVAGAGGDVEVLDRLLAGEKAHSTELRRQNASLRRDKKMIQRVLLVLTIVIVVLAVALIASLYKGNLAVSDNTKNVTGQSELKIDAQNDDSNDNSGATDTGQSNVNPNVGAN